ncbi:MAG: hypothetical protein KIS81_06235 [Maricaulaceae bacterium]|nr:hypothetical protein [Maricaulaceae bacterium]
MTGPDIPRLLEEIPLLYRVRAFADGLEAIPFLSRLGEPLDARERALARAWLDGLGFPHAEAALLTGWDEALFAAESAGHDSEGWEAEEMLRAGLSARAAERLDEEAAAAILAYTGQKAGEAAADAAGLAAWQGDVGDEGLLNAAAGAIVQAAHGAALVILAEAGDDEPPHPFLARWRLFARGRWPVGLAGSSFNIF